MKKIEILYPEVCNLYGDLANIEYISRSNPIEIIRTSLKEKPAFVDQDIDLVYMGSTTERGQTLACQALKPYISDIKKRIDDNKFTLITGNALEIFGEYIEKDDGSKEEMLGLFPIHAVQRLYDRYNSLWLGTFEGIDVVGFKSLFAFSYGDNGQGMMTTVRGDGLNRQTKAEGYRVNNFMMTYLIGPLNILNPLFARWLLEQIGIEDAKLDFEDLAMDSYNTRLREFRDPKRGYVY
ncbi:MAG: hypothetical protein IJM15_01725 [Erysipelotrichaceae bacterium]|nr:hypothetical protein [Erysipelotrichaceae bacterium]